MEKSNQKLSVWACFLSKRIKRIFYIHLNTGSANSFCYHKLIGEVSISKFKSPPKSTVIILLAVLSLLLGMLIFPVQAQVDSDNDGISDAKESELANRYVPVLQFKAGENFFPVDINYHVDNAVLKLRSGDNVVVVDSSPSVDEISTYTDENYFLENILGNFTEIASDYGEKKDSLGYTVYARVTMQFGSMIVQYWFFYAYNDSPVNQHEGDWEMIEIPLDNSEEPISAVYSQHMQGQRAVWGDVEKLDATHPVVYVARGSHANYFRPYQGKLGLENDDVGADGTAIKPTDVNLVLLGELGVGNHPASQNWLEFGGRWGDWAKLGDAAVGFAGPHGPGQVENSEKWYNPASWSENIALVGGTWFNLSWFAANFLLIFLVISAALGGLKLWRVVRRRKAGRLRLPAILKTKASIGIILGALGIGFTIAGMLLPWYTVNANIQTTSLSTGGIVELLVMDGFRGVQVNFLRGGEGLSPVFGLKIPLGILLLTGIIFSVLDIIGVEKTKSLGNKYIRSGIFFIVIVVVLVIFISQLTSTLPSLAASVGADLPPEAVEIAGTIAQQPLRGETASPVGDFGSVYLSWGLAIGAYMFVLAAATKIIGGIILRQTREPTPQPQAEKPPSK